MNNGMKRFVLPLLALMVSAGFALAQFPGWPADSTYTATVQKTGGPGNYSAEINGQSTFVVYTAQGNGNWGQPGGNAAYHYKFGMGTWANNAFTPNNTIQLIMNGDLTAKSVYLASGRWRIDAASRFSRVTDAIYVKGAQLWVGVATTFAQPVYFGTTTYTGDSDAGYRSAARLSANSTFNGVVTAAEATSFTAEGGTATFADFRLNGDLEIKRTGTTFVFTKLTPDGSRTITNAGGADVQIRTYVAPADGVLTVSNWSTPTTPMVVDVSKLGLSTESPTTNEVLKVTNGTLALADFATNPDALFLLSDDNKTLSVTAATYHYSASVSVDTEWADIAWYDNKMGANHEGALPEDAVAQLTVHNNAIITFDASQPVTLTALKIMNSGTLFAVSNLTGSGWQFSTNIVNGVITGDPVALAPAMAVEGYTLSYETTMQGFVISGRKAVDTININFHNGTAISGTNVSGFLPIARDNWSQIIGNAGTLTGLKWVKADGTVDTATLASATATISGTRGYWNLAANTNDPIMTGYIDEGQGFTSPTVVISDIPFASYRVVVYMSTDTAGAQFGHLTIGGVNYSAVNGTTVAGSTASWGNAGPSNNSLPLAEGTNFLISDNIQTPTVTVIGHRVDGDSTRGCIAAIQIIGVSGVSPLYEATVDAPTNWENIAWTLNGTPCTTADLPQEARCALTVSNNATITFDGTAPETTLGTLRVVGDATFAIMGGVSGVANTRTVKRVLSGIVTTSDVLTVEPPTVAEGFDVRGFANFNGISVVVVPKDGSGLAPLVAFDFQDNKTDKGFAGVAMTTSGTDAYVNVGTLSSIPGARAYNTGSGRLDAAVGTLALTAAQGYTFSAICTLEGGNWRDPFGFAADTSDANNANFERRSGVGTWAFYNLTGDPPMTGDLSPASDTDYHHYVLVVTNNTATVYIDGEQQATGTLQSGIAAATITRFAIGWSCRSDRRSANNFKFDDFRIYDKALTADQAASLFTGLTTLTLDTVTETTLTESTNWSAATWTPEVADWTTSAVGVTVTNATAASTLTVDSPVSVALLTTVATQPLTIATSDTGALSVAGLIDDTDSTATTTFGVGTGSSAVKAGADTVFAQAGAGALTIAAGKKATLNTGWTGSIANAGTLEYAFAVDGNVVFPGANATNIYSAGSTGRISSMNGGTALLKGGTFTLAGMDATATASELIMENGATVNFTSAEETVSNGIGNSFNLGTATFTMNGGTLRTQRFTLSEGNAGRASVINQNGGDITVTGDVSADENTTSIMFGHWDGSSTYNMNSGTFTATNCWVLIGKTSNAQTWYIGRSSGELGENDYPVARVKGVKFSGSANGANIFQIRKGGTLQVGPMGIDFTGKSVNCKIDGTLNAYDTFSSAIAFTTYLGATLDVDAEKTMTLNGIISDSGAEAATPFVKKTGSGILVLGGVNTYTGGTLLTAGTLTLNNNKSIANGVLTMNAGTTLNVSAAALNGSTPVATLSFDAGVSDAAPVSLVATLSELQISSGDQVKLVTLPAQTDLSKITLTVLDSVGNPLTQGAQNGYSLTWDGNTMLIASDGLKQKWTGAGTDNNWSTAANWENMTAPEGMLPYLRFAGTTRTETVNDVTGLAIQSMVFDADAGAFTLSGNALDVMQINNRSAEPQTITAAIGTAIPPTDPLELDSSAGAVTMGGAVMVTSFTKTGTAALTITNDLVTTGAATFNGPATLAGRMLIGGATVFNGGTTVGGSTNTFLGGVLANANITFASGSGTTITGEFSKKKYVSSYGPTRYTVASGATVRAGSWRFDGTWTEDTIAGDVTVEGTFYGYSNMQEATLTETISGSVTANKVETTGHSTSLLLKGGGRVNIGTGGISPRNNLTLRDITIGAYADYSLCTKMATITDTVTIDTLDCKDGETPRTITMAYVLAGAGSLVKTGAGTLVLNGTNTYAGTTTVNGGTLKMGPIATLGAGAWTFTDGVTFDISARTTEVGSATQEVTVPAGAAVTIAVGDRVMTEGLKLMSWSARPTGKFVLEGTALNELSAVKKDDGLYAEKGISGLILRLR